MKVHGDIELTGIPAALPSNQCWPGGVPFVFWNIGIEIIQQPHQVTILYSNDRDFRQIRMDQTHPAEVKPSWYGDSVGHYEGDTLVVDTVGVKIGPFASIDQYGTPHTEALHVIERYRLLDYDATIEAEVRGERENFHLDTSDAGFSRDLAYTGKGLQLEFRVDDEGVFTTPWSATMTYRRPLSGLGQWPEMVCVESTRTTYMTRDSAVPHADKPDF